MSNPCPCGSGARFDTCCGPALARTRWPETAEALMRSRYTAHVRGDIAWLRASLWPEAQAGFDPVSTAAFASSSHWTGLKILKTKRGRVNDTEGTVLFEARYLSPNGPQVLRENSLFRKSDGKWYYTGPAER